MSFLNDVLRAFGVSNKTVAPEHETAGNAGEQGNTKKSEVDTSSIKEGQRLVLAYIKRQIESRSWTVDLSTETAKAILSATPDVRLCAAVYAIELVGWYDKELVNPIDIAWVTANFGHKGLQRWQIGAGAHDTASIALRAKLSVNSEHVLKVLAFAARERYPRSHKHAIKMCEWLDHPLPPEVITGLKDLRAAVNSSMHQDASVRSVISRVDTLLNDKKLPLMEDGEPFGEAILAELAQMPVDRQSEWQKLIYHCQTANATKPSVRWIKTASSIIDSIGLEDFKTSFARIIKIFCDSAIPVGHDWRQTGFLKDKYTQNATVIKGLAWCHAYDAVTEPSVLGDLAIASFKKFPQVGARSVKVGNACIVVLGMLGTLDAASQLSRLNMRVRYFKALEMIDKALHEVAERLNLTTEDVEELCAPAFGLDENGVREEELGGSKGILRFNDGQASITWINADGKVVGSPPASAKKDHSAEIKELTSSVKEIAKAYSTQKGRLERILLSDRSWTYSVWCERYLNHALVGDIAKRLIWQFYNEEQQAEGIVAYGEVIDVTGMPIKWISNDTKVRLWHSISEEPAKVLSWRQFLETKQIKQPFKQAHREIYIVTDAELATNTYSNRFAAHIVRQHQFAALCRERGWHFQLLGWFDNHNVPTRELPQFRMRVEYWVETAQEFPTSESGVSLYITTDQVRFIDSNGNLIRMLDVPRRVFTELMRDIDLFVGVCSVGNDPNWLNQGERPTMNAYWQSYSFGELNASAQTRKDLLSRLIPKLKIADVATLEDKFLVIKGKRKTYKIHLGSSNILMKPNDRYLCIVPDRSIKGTENVFLPFEGDQTLALILSKAFLLAADDKIKDPVILAQLN